MEEISAEQFRAMRDRGDEYVLVDTRDDESFEAFHVAGAQRYRFLPDDDLDPAAFAAAVGAGPADTVVTLCAKGIASNALGQALEAAGYEDVRVVTRGMEAWSAVYDVAAVTTADSRLRVYQLQRRAKGCLGYVLAHDPSDEAVVVDPTRHTGEFLAVAEKRGYDLVGVLDSHVHADHLSGGRLLADRLGVPYYLPAAAAERDVEGGYEPLADGDTLHVGEATLTALHTPGHTIESTSYLLDEEAVFTGDTVFVDSVGRTELQFGDGEAATGARSLYGSLQDVLLTLPDDVTVLPGHFAVAPDGTADVTHGREVSTTVGALREIDLLGLEEDTFIARITERLPEKPPNYERVIDINAGRAAPETEQDAVELELGPNRCAATADD